MPQISSPLAGEPDFAHCRRIIKDGSKSFHAASLMLPERLRGPAFALYAFCRVSDDAVDGPGAEAAVTARLRQRLVAAYAGAPFAHPVDRALAETVRRFSIPRSVFDALIEGLDWDLAGKTYDTLEEVEAYGARVAGSVGAMMAALMGARARPLLARACDLGVAMQLTNIARDVGEDARNGRLYLPRAWLTAAGLDVGAWMAAPSDHPAIRAATLRLLDRADQLYARADAGIAGLPADCRSAIRAARLIYAEIGQAVRRAGGDSVTSRAVTSKTRKLALAAQALATPLRFQPTALTAPPLVATAYLVDAVANAPVPAPPKVAHARLSPLQKWDDDWGRVFQLFEDLEYRKRAG